MARTVLLFAFSFLFTAAFCQSEASELTLARVLCPGDSLELDGGAAESYLWSTGDTTRYLAISQPGLYSVLAFTGSTSAEVTFRVTAASELTGRIPNIFSPNGDGRNEVFRPVPELPASAKYNLQIFNRSGVEVFHSQLPAIGWNGKTDLGEAQPEGSYFAIVVFETTCGLQTYSGSLSLVR